MWNLPLTIDYYPNHSGGGGNSQVLVVSQAHEAVDAGGHIDDGKLCVQIDGVAEGLPEKERDNEVAQDWMQLERLQQVLEERRRDIDDKAEELQARRNASVTIIDVTQKI